MSPTDFRSRSMAERLRELNGCQLKEEGTNCETVLIFVLFVIYEANKAKSD